VKALRTRHHFEGQQCSLWATLKLEGGILAKINPQVIRGKWRVGRALDVHTVSSNYVGVDQFGHDRYETTRSEISELLYRLKYNQDTSVIPEITGTASSFLRTASKVQPIPFHVIVPVPASSPRPVQPVLLIAQANR
jgi:competence protein ComFC